MNPILKLGLAVDVCSALEKHAGSPVEVDDSILDLPLEKITDENLPQYMEQLGNLVVKHAGEVKKAVADHMSSWYEGYMARLKELKVDDDKLVKSAQQYFTGPDFGRGLGRTAFGYLRQQMPPAPKDMRIMGDTSDMMRKLLGDGIVGTGADLGLYMIPGVGAVRTGIDAVSDFTNVFSKGLNWKQRLGFAASGLANTAMTALDVLTLGFGGRLAHALGKGAKSLLKGGKTAQRFGKAMGSTGKAITHGRAAIHRGLNAASAAGKWYSPGARMLRRGTDFGEAGRVAAHKASQQATGEGFKGFAKRRWLGGKHVAKNMAGGIGINSPMIGMIMGGQMMAGGGMSYPQMGGGQMDPTQFRGMLDNQLASQQGYGGQPSMPIGIAAYPGSLGYYGSQGSSPNFRGSSLGSGVSPLSRYSAGQRF